MFVSRALDAILNDRDIKRAQCALLKTACETALNDIRAAHEGSGDSAASSAGDDGSSGNNSDIKINLDSEKFFVPFELACQCDSARIVVTALDCLQKLLAHGYLTGNYPDSTCPNRRLIDRIVETICTCFTGLDTDEGVELQIIKALLTVTTCQQVEIHEASLLLAMRTSVNIYLTSKNSVNQTTAKAMLTQMLNGVFVKMENHMNDVLSSATSLEQQPYVEKFVFASAPVVDNNGNINLNQTEHPVSQDSNEDDVMKNKNSTEDGESNSQPQPSSMDSGYTERSSATGTNSSEETKSPAVNENESSQQFPTSQIAAESLNVAPSCIQFNHVSQKDGFLVFWSLCKMSLQVIPDGVLIDPKSIDIKTKILGLELLKSIVKNAGVAFKKDPICIAAVKQYLCEALYKNVCSNYPDLVQSAMDIYLILLGHFRHAVKEELQIFFEEFFFPSLESSEILPEYRQTCLRMLDFICSDTNCLIDLHVNYDENPMAADIFVKLMQYLSAMVKEELHFDSEEDKIMREKGVERILSVLKCMAFGQDLKNPKLEQPKEESDFKCLTNEEISTMDFTDKDFTSCFQYLMDSFAFPSQENDLDKLFMSIAHRFYECNQSNKLYENPDSLYNFAHSIYSLVDDRNKQQLHTSKEQFISRTRSINNCPGLPKDVLSYAYDTFIEKRPPLKSQVSQDGHSTAAISPLTSTESVQLLKRMFKVTAQIILSSLSTCLQETNDPKVSDLCLEGIHYSIHIACIYSMKGERDAFIQMLTRLTQIAIQEISSKKAQKKVVTNKTTKLTTSANGVTTTTVTTTTEMKCKSIDAIQTLLVVAVTEGNWLASSWFDVLKCISQLEKSRLLEMKPEEELEANNEQPRSKSPRSWTSWAAGLLDPLHQKKLLDPSMKKSMGATIEKIFHQSRQLSSDGIVHYMKGLCQIALAQLAHAECSKIVSLQRILDAVYLNIDRIPAQWSRIWDVVVELFVHVACSSDEELSTFAINSIVQLSSKLMLQPEQPLFHFKSYYIWPLEEILRNTQCRLRREMVIGCILQIIEDHSAHLQSGWRTIFSIFQSSVEDSDEQVVQKSFETVCKIIELYERNPNGTMESLPDVAKCLSEFACKAKSQEISEEAMRLLRHCGSLLLTIHGTKESDNEIVWVRGWLPILMGFSTVVIYCTANDCKEDLRARALSEMFGIIKADGAAFHVSWWQEIFQIIFKIYEKLKLAEVYLDENERSYSPTSSNSGDFNGYYCYYYVQFAMIDICTQYFKMIGSLILPDVMDHLKWNFKQGQMQLARSGIYCLHQLLEKNGLKFSSSHWDLTCEFIKDVFEITKLQCDMDGVDDELIAVQQHKVTSLIQVELIKTVHDIVLAPTNFANNEKRDEKEEVFYHLSLEQIVRLIDCLEDVFMFVKGLTREIEHLKESPRSNRIDYIQQEAQSITVVLKLLFRVYFDRTRKDLMNIEERVIRSCEYFLERIIEVGNSSNQEAYSEAFEFTLNNLLVLPEEKFKMHTSIIYPHLCNIVQVDLKPESRLILREYFIRIGGLFCVNGDCE